jgi:hypothetical protein
MKEDGGVRRPSMRLIRTDQQPDCAFCGKSHQDAKMLIASPDHFTYTCDECTLEPSRLKAGSTNPIGSKLSRNLCSTRWSDSLGITGRVYRQKELRFHLVVREQPRLIYMCSRRRALGFARTAWLYAVKFSRLSHAQRVTHSAASFRASSLRVVSLASNKFALPPM